MRVAIGRRQGLRHTLARSVDRTRFAKSINRTKSVQNVVSRSPFVHQEIPGHVPTEVDRSLQGRTPQGVNSPEAVQ